MEKGNKISIIVAALSFYGPSCRKSQMHYSQMYDCYMFTGLDE